MTGSTALAEIAPFDFADDFTIDPRAAAAVEEREAQLAASEAAAYARGHEDGAGAERAAMATKAAQALEAIAGHLETLDAEIVALRRRSAEDARDLAFAFARKIAGGLVRADPVAPVAEAFAAVLDDLRGQSEATVFIHPDIAAAVEARIRDVIGERLAALRLAFRADADLTPGDCRIEWPDGGLIRDIAALEARLEDLVRTSLAIDTEETSS